MDLFCGNLIKACMVAGIDNDNLYVFEKKVEAKLSSLKYKCVIVLIANYNSHSKAVKYIIDNFTTMDILSKDIDFHCIGYSNNQDIPLETEPVAKNQILDAAILELESLSNNEVVSSKRINALKNKLIALKFSPNCNADDYHGDTRITSIYNKRLGTILFRESVFSHFISELTKKTNGNYSYIGGCDLVFIPFINMELKYENCTAFNLDSIINADAALSLDGFLYGIMQVMNSYEDRLIIPSLVNKSYKEAFNDYKQFMDFFHERYLSKNQEDKIRWLEEMAIDLIDEYEYNCPIFFKSKKDFFSKANAILSEFNEEYDSILYSSFIHEIKVLYAQATSALHFPSHDEMKERLIKDIENHLHWKLSENFFFISYSSKDKTKAELIRRKLEDHNAKVWIAPDGIPQGRDYASVIPATLRCTKNFVLILTKNSAESQWVLREIDSAINNSQALLRIVLADGFSLKDFDDYEDLKFYLNKVQISYRYEDIIQDDTLFNKFMN